MTPKELEELTEFPTDFLDTYCSSQVGHTDWAFMDYDIIDYLQSLSQERDCSPPNTDQIQRNIESIVIFYKEDEGGHEGQDEEDAWLMSEEG